MFSFQMYNIINGCPFRFFLGVPCPGCGMTRAFLSLLRLDFKMAFAYHPLWPLVILIAILCILKWCFYREKCFIDSKIKNIVIFCIVFIFVLVYIIRVASKDPIVMPNVKSGFVYMVVNDIIKNVR